MITPDFIVQQQMIVDFFKERHPEAGLHYTCCPLIWTDGDFKVQVQFGDGGQFPFSRHEYWKKKDDKVISYERKVFTKESMFPESGQIVYQDELQVPYYSIKV